MTITSPSTKTIRFFLFIHLIILVAGQSGCGQKQQWFKPGINQHTFEKDAAYCRKQAARSTYQDPFAFADGEMRGLEQSAVRERIFEHCMTARGYRLQRKTEKKITLPDR
ncbi:MAG: hypothetical protein GXY53_00900 [Desulfobulbus sp.]|nr:hypothetical protein [Desulfobulbus sp.]